MGSITVIITVYKRNYLDEQLAALLNQSIRPEHIWIIQNENNVNISDVVCKYASLFPNLSVFHSQFNLKYFGRFSLAAFAETEFVYVIDDDVIPGSKWLEICLVTSNRFNAVVSCSGRIIMPDTFRPEEIEESKYPYYFIGDNYNTEEYNYCPVDTLVDYGCNSYFFRKDLVRSFWHTWPCTFLSGEDIHLSATSKILCSVPTIVPAQTGIHESGNTRKYYSQDMHSSWRNSDFIDIREKVFKYLINTKGWKPLLWNEPELLSDYSVPCEVTCEKGRLF